MSFHHVRINDAVNTRITGGPRRKTSVIEQTSGVEYRNTSWADSQHVYIISYQNRNARELERLKAFFEVHGGKLIGFQYKDWMDYKSCSVMDTPKFTDQVIARGDGKTRVFQLVKNYEVGNLGYSRDIVLPLAGTVKLGVSGKQVGGVLLPNGLVMLDAVPRNNAVITAGYEFDVPVRFDTDELDIMSENPHIGSAQRLSIVELKRPLASVSIQDYDYVLDWIKNSKVDPEQVVHWSSLLNILVNVTWPEYF